MEVSSPSLVNNNILPGLPLTFSDRSAASRCFFFPLLNKVPNSNLLVNFILNILTEPNLHVYLLRATLDEDIIPQYHTQIFGLHSFLSEYVVSLSAFCFIKIQAKRISSLGQAWTSSSCQMSLALLSVLQAKEFNSFPVALQPDAVPCPGGESLHCPLGFL